MCCNISAKLIAVLLISLLMFSCKEQSKGNNISVDIEEGCSTGINNSTCSSEAVEDSIWGFLPLETDQNGKIKEENFNHFYKFYSNELKWEHYLYFKISGINKYLLEKRSGTFEIIGSDKIKLQLTSSSCSGQTSLFSIYDQDERELEIYRNSNSLRFGQPKESISGFKTSFDNDKSILQNLIEGMVYIVVRFAIEVTLMLLTPDFWEDVITGSFNYHTDINVQHESYASNCFEACLSTEGMQIVLDQFN